MIVSLAPLLLLSAPDMPSGLREGAYECTVTEVNYHPGLGRLGERQISFGLGDGITKLRGLEAVLQGLDLGDFTLVSAEREHVEFKAPIEYWRPLDLVLEFETSDDRISLVWRVTEQAGVNGEWDPQVGGNGTCSMRLQPDREVAQP